MKTVWFVECNTLEGDKTERFDSFKDAKIFSRNTIIECFNIRKESFNCFLGDGTSAYRRDVADYLFRYFSDPDFPPPNEDVPEEDEDDDLNIWIDDSYIDTEGSRCGLPEFSTDMVLMEDAGGVYYFNSDILNLELYSSKVSGGCSNPVIVLEALQQGCASYEEIKQYGENRHHVSISERTIRRHMKLLSDLGYQINKNERGFTIEGKTTPNTNIKFKTSAHALIILEILSRENRLGFSREQIISLMWRDYRCVVTRKALWRNLKTLRALVYKIEKRLWGLGLN